MQRALFIASIAAFIATSLSQSPSIETVDGNLYFKLNKDGSRAAVVVNGGTPIFFDELADSGVQTSATITTVYELGKDIGQQQCELAHTNDQIAFMNMLQTALKNYSTSDSVNLVVNAEETARQANDNLLQLKLDTLSQNFSALLNTMNQRFATLAAQLDAVTALANSRGAADDQNTSWVAMQVGDSKSLRAYFLPNVKGQILKIFGVGFDDITVFHPSLGHTTGFVAYTDFKCAFVSSGGSVQTNGVMVPLDDDGFFHIECPTPEPTTPTTYTVSVLNGTTVIPFTGLKNRDVLNADEFWTKFSADAKALYIEVFGIGSTTSLKASIIGTTYTGVCNFLNATMFQCPPVRGPAPVNGRIVGSSLKVEVLDASQNVLRPLSIGPIGAASAPTSVNIDACENGVKDGTETDIDCGGAFCKKCRMKQACATNFDCGSNGPAVCNSGKTCATGNGTLQFPGETCKSILRDNPNSASGIYWVTGLGNYLAAPIQVVCDMNQARDGGGWTLVLKSWYDFTFDHSIADGVASCTEANEYGCRRVCGSQAMGSVLDGLTLMGNRYKLEDEFVRQGVIGPTENFDILGDQIGVNTAYSNGNYEYILMKGYTGRWRFDALTETSRTGVVMSSWRISDNRMAWQGELKCGTQGGAHPNGKGINCYALVDRRATLLTAFDVNPMGGAGCTQYSPHGNYNVNMGIASNPGWHHLFMFEHNSDSYVYMCNGPQHSSGFNMNHRWWFRDRT